MKPLYTKEQLNFLSSGFKQLRIPALTISFNQKFGTDKGESAIRSTLKNHKFKCGRPGGLSKGERPSLSAEQISWLREKYKTLSQIEITKAFNAKYNESKSVAAVSSMLKVRNISSGRTGHYAKGHTGNIINPLGHERICSKDGYILVKVAERNPYTGAPTRYRHKHGIAWEKQYGPLLKNHVITFIDDDKTNCDIENLEIISRAEHCRRNKMQLASQPDELKPTIKMLAKLITKTSSVSARGDI